MVGGLLGLADNITHWQYFRILFTDMAYPDSDVMYLRVYLGILVGIKKLNTGISIMGDSSLMWRQS